MLLWPLFFGDLFLFLLVKTKLKSRTSAAYVEMVNPEALQPTFRERCAIKIQIVQSRGLCNRAGTQPERAGARKAFEKAVRFTCAPAFKTGEIND